MDNDSNKIPPFNRFAYTWALFHISLKISGKLTSKQPIVNKYPLTMKWSDCTHIENPCPAVCEQGIPVGFRESTTLSSVWRNQVLKPPTPQDLTPHYRIAPCTHEMAIVCYIILHSWKVTCKMLTMIKWTHIQSTAGHETKIQIYAINIMAGCCITTSRRLQLLRRP